MAVPTTRVRVQPAAKPRNDAYTGLLFISFLALVISAILLFLDYNQYGTTTPPKPTLAQPGSSTPFIPAEQPPTTPPAGEGEKDKNPDKDKNPM